MIPHVTVADYALWGYCVDAECEVITIHDTLYIVHCTLYIVHDTLLNE